ncbi:hypothetical protein PJIAN_211 [Paludibacter jiangxiensis]|uniref:Uncharacterized protein n=1 Tax=Paludibacter jiangxiensis TaxID=681398 RepID=A0A170Z9W3_9BACT|nr:hypothetical protein PJIAN_211 [Paludibacter jiangxiensis]
MLISCGLPQKFDKSFWGELLISLSLLCFDEGDLW